MEHGYDGVLLTMLILFRSESEILLNRPFKFLLSTHATASLIYYFHFCQKSLLSIALIY